LQNDEVDGEGKLAMARILILGGGFAGVVCAERLAKELGDEHQITLVSRSRQFVFYPALVRLAFGKCDIDDVSFDLRKTMLSRRVNFIEAEVAHLDPFARTVSIAHGEVEGTLGYDYLIFALGRRLATERIAGFYEHAHHLLNVDKAIQFGKEVRKLEEGRVVLGQAPNARLPVPVYESAFALTRLLGEKGLRDKVRVTVISPTTLDDELRDRAAASALKHALEAQQIEFLPNVSVASLTNDAIRTADGTAISFNLLMLVPPFRGAPAGQYLAITNEEGYINVDPIMHVVGHERMYAVGDCVNFDGPKMGHMAVRQAQVAAANLAAQIMGHEPVAHYQHEMRFVIEGAGRDTIYLHKDLWRDDAGSVRQGRFWSWAKQMQEKYWQVSHS
jgi:NADH dehydrogenase FAD-containing subunit